MAAQVQNFVIEQGAAFRHILGFFANGSPAPLTGLQARMQIRRRVGGPLILGLTTEDDPNGHSYLQLSSDSTQLTIFIGASVTDTFTKGGVYDLEVYDPTNPDNVLRLLKGTVAIDKEVTV